MSRLLLSIILLIRSLSLHSQSTPVELWKAVEYVKSINLQGPTIAVDKGRDTYMLTNQTDVNPFGGFTLAKYDSSGNQLWNRNYPPTIFGHFYGGLLVDSAGASYVSINFDGSIPDYEADAALLKYSPDGEKLWEGKYGANQVGDNYINYIDLDITGHLIAFGRNVSDTSATDNFLFVSAIDTSNGEELWKTKISGIFIPQNMRIYGDHIQLVASQYESGNVYYAIIQLNSVGTIIQEKTKPYTGYPIDFSCITRNGDIVFGNRGFGYDVTRVTMSGDTLWRYHYPDIYGSVTNWTHHILEDDSLYIYATGTIQLPGLSTEFVTTKFSPDGELLWQNIYHTANDSLGDAAVYVQTNDSFAIAGGGTQLSNGDAVGLIKVYDKKNGDEKYNIFLGSDNIFIIDKVLVDGNILYYTGEGFTGSISSKTVITGCIRLPNITSGNNNIANQGTIHLFPNPSSDYLFVNDIDKNLFDYIEIVDIQGKIVMRTKIEQGNMHIPLSTFSSGTYIVILKGENVTITKKIIKI